MRDTLRSLKDKVAAGGDQTAEGDARPGEAPAEASDAAGARSAATGKRGEVGTSGALSVETRHPAPPGAGAGRRGGSTAGGRLLSRAGQAVKHAGGGRWGGVAALCVVALALVAAALAVRRSRDSV